jgi:ketosteroid isomerase-like protein
MTPDQVQAWLDAYVEAWQTYDQASIEALFSEDAEYRFHPWDEPLRGRTAIVDSWLNPSGGPASSRDEPGTWAAEYHPFAVAGRRAVAIGWTAYYEDATQQVLERTYENNWLLEFDETGRCRSFVEYFMKRPAR